MQGATMFIVIMVSFILMYRIHERTVQPLRDLVESARRIKSGDFSARFFYNDQDELGLLSRTFNQMAEELSLLYTDLELRVRQKTAELQRSNKALGLLYETSRRIYANPAQMAHSLPNALAQLQETTGLKSITLCLRKTPGVPAYRTITTQNQPPPFCHHPRCDKCEALPNQTQTDRAANTIFNFPIGGSEYFGGDLYVESNATDLEEWQRELLAAITDMIATALSLANIGEQEARLALMEERAVIARELHDSLAQSLSYQKLQTSRMKRLLEKDLETVPAPINEAISNIQEGLNSAYKQLRELLATFRMKINAPGLEPALIGAVAEMRDKSNIDIDLNYELTHCPLTPNEEIHCLQIVRESLSNVVKHSRSEKAWVILRQIQDQLIELSIRDNGVGLPEHHEKPNHYGMAILSERAESLKGKLQIGNHPEGGACVTVIFQPEFSRKSTEQAET
jgi:two-component system nitrate/nitrite sensor histidine kinase NarX